MQIMAVNMFTAMVLASFFAVTAWSLALLIFDRGREARTVLLRAVTAAAFLAIGCLYMIISAPLMMWDKPSRGVASSLVLGVFLLTAYRHKQGATPSPSRRWRRFGVPISLFLLVVLGAASLMRVGFVTLTGDRVTFLVNVTGETRTETVPWRQPDGSNRDVAVVAHHVLFTHPYGKTVANLWIDGDSFDVKGQARLLSPTLNWLWIPNLYELNEVCSTTRQIESPDSAPSFSMPFPHLGPLAIYPWWGPIESRLFSFWLAHFSGNSLWGLRTVNNQSPEYPLVDDDGKPAQGTFLLVFEPWGLPTSRGSSPFEKKGPPPRPVFF